MLSQGLSRITGERTCCADPGCEMDGTLGDEVRPNGVAAREERLHQRRDVPIANLAARRKPELGPPRHHRLIASLCAEPPASGGLSGVNDCSVRLFVRGIHARLTGSS